MVAKEQSPMSNKAKSFLMLTSSFWWISILNLVKLFQLNHTYGGHMSKKALITGITGQDGAYLARLLLSLGYEVHGIKRRSSSFNTSRIDDIYNDSELGKRFHLHHGDLNDASNLMKIITEVQPDEVYNLAAQSHVQVSFEAPEYTANVDGLGTIRLLEVIRQSKKPMRFYQASTSELYGKVQETHSRKRHPSIPEALMVPQSFTPTGSRLTTVKLMASMQVTASYLTMRVL